MFLICSLPFSPNFLAYCGLFKNCFIAKAAPSTEWHNRPEYLCFICSGIPPALEATTGLAFHRASETVKPNPSRIDFCTTTVEALCRALTSKSACGNNKIWISLSCCAFSLASSSTFKPSGSSVAVPPARINRQSTYLFTNRYASITPAGSFRRSKREICVIMGLSCGMLYFLNTISIVSCGNSLFLSLRGSMEGEIKNCLMGSICEKAGAENTAAS